MRARDLAPVGRVDRGLLSAQLGQRAARTARAAEIARAAAPGAHVDRVIRRDPGIPRVRALLDDRDQRVPLAGDGPLPRLARSAGSTKRATPALFTTMGSAGGTLDTATTRRLPVRTILSGPAGGVAGALWVAQAAGVERFITCDMGGTSTDVCVVEDGRPALVGETAFRRLPAQRLAVRHQHRRRRRRQHRIRRSRRHLASGAAQRRRRSRARLLRARRHQPTVTDANLLLGRLGTERRLGGSVALDRRAARRRHQWTRDHLGHGRRGVAEGIIELAAARMSGAIRASRSNAAATRRLHAAAVRRRGRDARLRSGRGTRRARVLVPVAPGNLSALGLLASDLRQELVRTWVRRLGEVGDDELAALIAAQEAAGVALPLLAGLPPERVRSNTRSTCATRAKRSRSPCRSADGGLDTHGVAPAFSRPVPRTLRAGRRARSDRDRHRAHDRRRDHRQTAAAPHRALRARGRADRDALQALCAARSSRCRCTTAPLRGRRHLRGRRRRRRSQCHDRRASGLERKGR